MTQRAVSGRRYLGPLLHHGEAPPPRAHAIPSRACSPQPHSLLVVHWCARAHSPVAASSFWPGQLVPCMLSFDTFEGYFKRDQAQNG